MSAHETGARAEHPVVQGDAPVDRLVVEAVMRRVLDSNLWGFSRNYSVTIEPGSRVDFWIRTSGPEPVGCAVLVFDGTDPPADIARASATVEVLDRSDARYQALAVVLAADLTETDRARIRDALGSEPLVYVARSFEEDFAAATKAMLHRLAQRGTDALAGVPDRLERMDRLQVRTQSVLVQLTDQVNALRGELSALTQRESTDLFEDRRSTESARLLPKPIVELFDGVLRRLDDLAAIGGTVSTMFELTLGTPNGMAGVRQLSNAPEVPLRGLGLAALLRSVIGSFRHAIENWFAGLRPLSGAVLPPRARDELRLLCSRYDEACSWLPMRELHGLSRIPRAAGSVQPDDDEIVATQLQLERLGDDVREVALGLFAAR